MLSTRRWKQLAALAAAGGSAYLAYKRWAAYKEDEEDAAAAEGYYRSRSRAAGGAEGADAGANVRPLGGLGDAEPWLERTELLIGAAGLKDLAKAHVLVVGQGGVGSYATEFLVRAGIGKITIIDGDDIDPTNRNRQLPALSSTHYKFKVAVMEARLRDINPNLEITAIQRFLECHECLPMLEETAFDYIVDCIDSLQPKLHLMHAALKTKTPIISSMGAGGKTDPFQVKVADISESDTDPFAKFIRKRLRKQFGIKSGVACIFSGETPDRNAIKVTDGTNYKKSSYGTISYLPGLFGLCAASVCIRELGLKKKLVYPKTRRHLIKQGQSAAWTSDFLTRPRGEDAEDEGEDEGAEAGCDTPSAAAKVAAGAEEAGWAAAAVSAATFSAAPSGAEAGWAGTAAVSAAASSSATPSAAAVSAAEAGRDTAAGDA